jgi:hypothetical protein
VGLTFGIRNRGVVSRGLKEYGQYDDVSNLSALEKGDLFTFVEPLRTETVSNQSPTYQSSLDSPLSYLSINHTNTIGVRGTRRHFAPAGFEA